MNATSLLRALFTAKFDVYVKSLEYKNSIRVCRGRNSRSKSRAEVNIITMQRPSKRVWLYVCINIYNIHIYTYKKIYIYTYIEREKRDADKVAALY